MTEDGRKRAALYGVAGVVAVWILWRMFYPDYLANRCRELGYQAVVADLRSGPPPRPSDMRWYQEHCWQGAPR